MSRIYDATGASMLALASTQGWGGRRARRMLKAPEPYPPSLRAARFGWFVLCLLLLQFVTQRMC